MLRNVLILFTGSLYTQALSFITGIVIIKMVTLEEYGAYAIITSFINMAILPLARFFFIAIKRYVPIYRSEGNLNSIKGLISTSIIYVLLLTIISTIILIKFNSFFLSKILKIDFRYTQVFIIYVIGLPFLTLAPIFSNFLLGFEKFREYTYSVNLLPNGTRLVYTVIWWLYIPLKVIGAVTGLILKNVINVIFSIWFLKKELLSLYLSNIKSKYHIREWFFFSLPFALKHLVNYISQNIGVILLGNLHSTYEAGIFRIANFIVMAIYSFSISFSGVILPQFSKEISIKQRVPESLLLKSSFQNFVITSAMVFMSIIISKPFLLALGENYIAGYHVILILSFMLLLESWSYPWQDMLIAAGRTSWILITHIFASLISIVGSFFLINLYGINGAAMGIVLESIVAFIFRFYWLWKLGVSINLLLDKRLISLFAIILSFILLLF